MKGKKSFTAYCDWITTFEELTNEEAGRLIKHILKYVNDENPIANDRITELTFAPIKATLKRDLDKWVKRVERNKTNGSKGGRPKNPQEPKKPTGLICNPKNPQEPDSDSDSDSDSVKEVNISFGVFWNLYDKKVGDKKKCESKWLKLKDDVRLKIIETLPAFKNSVKDKQFLPYPMTYLNQQRWNDEDVINEKPKTKQELYEEEFKRLAELHKQKS